MLSLQFFFLFNNHYNNFLGFSTQIKKQTSLTSSVFHKTLNSWWNKPKIQADLEELCSLEILGHLRLSTEKNKISQEQASNISLDHS